MEPLGDDQMDAPTEPPVDAAEEKQRLITEAARHGIDPVAAIDLAEKLAHLEPAANAYRAVDRRLATGCSLEEAEDILLG